jgi:hypothetical protein
MKKNILINPFPWNDTNCDIHKIKFLFLFSICNVVQVTIIPKNIYSNLATFKMKVEKILGILLFCSQFRQLLANFLFLIFFHFYIEKRIFAKKEISNWGGGGMANFIRQEKSLGRMNG